MSKTNLIEAFRPLDRSAQLGLLRKATADGNDQIREALFLANPALKSTQIPEYNDSGQLTKHRHYNPDTGRVHHTYTGDSRVWRNQFELPGQPGVIPSPQSFEKIEGTVSHAGHETLIARSPDGSERVVHVKRDPR